MSPPFQCLSSRPAWQIGDVERLIREGEAISSGLPSLTVLREAMRKAKEWMTKAKSLKLTSTDPAFPYLETLEALVAKGRPLPVKLEPMLTNLETQVASCRAWRERTARVFLKKNSSLTLLDVLCPRTDVGVEGKRRRKSHQPQSREDVSIPHPTFQHLTPQQLADPKKFVQTYHDSEREEFESMKRLRERNKLEADTAKIEGKTNAKIECELCLEYFHPGQISLQQLATGSTPSGSSPAAGGGNPGSPGSQQQQKKVSSLREIKFLCPTCLVSRRPRLETILSLLVALQKLNVRLAEGDALQCLAERAMAWRSKAEAALATEEVKTAFAKLQERKSTTTDKAAGSGDEDSNGSPSRRSPVYEVPEVTLVSATVAALEELMLKGDLLEVSLDESQHIFRLLQATEPRRSKEYPDLGVLEAELESVREEKMKARRKRRMESGEKEKEKDGRGGVGGGQKRQKKEVTTTKRRQAEAEDDEGGEEEQEDCSAPPSCLKPTGKEVSYLDIDYISTFSPDKQKNYICRTIVNMSLM